MVGVFENEPYRPIPSKTPNSKVKPVFGVVVQTNIGVALKLDGERGGGSDCG